MVFCNNKPEFCVFGPSGFDLGLDCIHSHAPTSLEQNSKTHTLTGEERGIVAYWSIRLWLCSLTTFPSTSRCPWKKSCYLDVSDRVSLWLSCRETFIRHLNGLSRSADLTVTSFNPLLSPLQPVVSSTAALSLAAIVDGNMARWRQCSMRWRWLR